MALSEWKYQTSATSKTLFARKATPRKVSALTLLTASTSFLVLFLPVRTTYRVAISLMLVLIASGAVGQQRDASAVAALQSTIAALGGQAAVSQITDSVATGTTILAGNGPSRAFTWKTLGAEFRYETTIGGDFLVFVSGHGTPANAKNGAVTALPIHVSLAAPAYHNPALLLSAEVNDRTYTLIAMGNGTLPNGQPAVHVQTISNAFPEISTVTQQDWYLDPNTQIPLRVEYCSPATDSPTDCLFSAIDYSAYQNTSGVLVPQVMALSVNGAAFSTSTITGTAFNVGLSPSDFSLIVGGGN